MFDVEGYRYRLLKVDVLFELQVYWKTMLAE